MPGLPSKPPPPFVFHFHVGQVSNEIPTGRVPVNWAQDVLDPSLPRHSVLPIIRKALGMSYHLRSLTVASPPASTLPKNMDYDITIYAIQATAIRPTLIHRDRGGRRRS